MTNKRTRGAGTTPPSASTSDLPAGSEPATSIDVGRLELREEELVARKELHPKGEVVVRTEIEEVPARLEVDSFHEEVEIEHVPVGRVVNERQEASEQSGDWVIPVYEEQLVLAKRLVLKEEIHVRRLRITERVLFEDTIAREKVVTDDLPDGGAVRESYVVPEDADSPDAVAGNAKPEKSEDGGLMEKVVRKVMS